MSFIATYSWLLSATHRYLRIPYTLNHHVFQAPKRPRATFVLIHGIGNTLHSWDEVVAEMPRDVKVVGIDLLGFGGSPRPSWATYNARTQARSVGATLLKLGLVKDVVLVGHSLGALVSVEVTRRYPLMIKRLVLCSPPFYKPRVSSGRPKTTDDALRSVYAFARKYPQQLIRLSSLAVKAGVANKTLSITDETVDLFIATLESGIVNQTSLRDVAALSVRIDIFYGALDAVVVNRNIVKLGKDNSNITAHRVVSGHEVIGGYAKAVGSFLADLPSRRGS